jgi:transposase-like protein
LTLAPLEGASSGVGRRRRWSNADKGRIVAESFAPGAAVSEVARRHEITPQHLFAWRKAARHGQLALPADEALWRSIKYEEVYLRAYDSVSEARVDRPHSSLDGATPDQAYFSELPIRMAA